jgi:hypothetical protein
MARVSFSLLQNAAVVPSPEGALGQVETRAVFALDRDPIHLHLHHLDAGASMRFAGDSTDRLLYVWRGDVGAGRTRLSPRSSAIVEYGAALTVTASVEGAELLEFNMKERGVADRAGGHVHLLPDEHVRRIVNTNGGKRAGMSLHADSQCDTCRLWLHEIDYTDSDVETPIHSHSEDEVMFITAGSIRVGNKIYGPARRYLLPPIPNMAFSPALKG